MIRLAVAFAAVALPLAVTANVNNAFSPKRVAVVQVRTVAGASCMLTDALTGARFHAVATKAGRVTWRWRPSVWANGQDTATVRCAKGSFHRSTQVPLVFLLLQQVHVLRDYAVHLVYWDPGGEMPADVAPAVSQLETDLKAALDAGATDNPFAVPRGFGDSLGGGDPRIASVDSTVVTDPYPRKPAAGYCKGSTARCLGRADFDTEVARLARQHGWAAGNRSLVMIFTSPSVTACLDQGLCTRGSEPCGFHGLTPAGYAYAEVIMSGMSSSCPFLGTPAEYAIALVGHEQNEAVVDPQGQGVEVADPCQGQVESVLINGHSYELPAIELPSTKCAFGYTP